MAKRVLMAITPPMSGGLRGAARSAASIARNGGGAARMVTVHPIPPPRVDRYGRVVADADRAMVRLADAAEEQMAALRWEFGEVDVERIVRFGRLGASPGSGLVPGPDDGGSGGAAAGIEGGRRRSLREARGASGVPLTLGGRPIGLPERRETRARWRGRRGVRGYRGGGGGGGPGGGSGVPGGGGGGGGGGTGATGCGTREPRAMGT